MVGDWHHLDCLYSPVPLLLPLVAHLHVSSLHLHLPCICVEQQLLVNVHDGAFMPMCTLWLHLRRLLTHRTDARAHCDLPSAALTGVLCDRWVEETFHWPARGVSNLAGVISWVCGMAMLISSTSYIRRRWYSVSCFHRHPPKHPSPKTSQPPSLPFAPTPLPYRPQLGGLHPTLMCSMLLPTSAVAAMDATPPAVLGYACIASRIGALQ